MVAEIICARELLIRCGSDEITWKHLVQQKAGLPSRGWLQELRRLAGARNIYKWTRDSVNTSLVDRLGHMEFIGYLLAVENTQCSERRDKLFCLRAILHSTSMRNAIRVDYNTSIPELCAKTLKATMIIHHHGYDQKDIDEYTVLYRVLRVSLQMTVIESLQLVDLLLDDSEGLYAPALDVVDYIFWYGDLTEAFFKITYVPLDREWSWKRKKEYLVSWRDKARHTEWPPPVPSPGSA